MQSPTSQRNFKIWITVLAIIAIVAAISIVGILSFSSASTAYAGNQINSGNSTVPTSAAIDSVQGLNLTLMLNSTQIQPGETINIAILEQNTLNATNTVNASGAWPIPELSIGPCGTLNTPFGVAIYSGYYTASNISSAQPLQVYQPGMYACPMILLDIASYTFQPLSDQATINTGISAMPTNMNVTLSYGIPVNGSWTYANDSGQGSFSILQPGYYTVAGGDEWGALVLLHFVVQ